MIVATLVGEPIIAVLLPYTTLLSVLALPALIWVNGMLAGESDCASPATPAPLSDAFHSADAPTSTPSLSPDIIEDIARASAFDEMDAAAPQQHLSQFEACAAPRLQSEAAADLAVTSIGRVNLSADGTKRLLSMLARASAASNEVRHVSLRHSSLLYIYAILSSHMQCAANSP